MKRYTRLALKLNLQANPAFKAHFVLCGYGLLGSTFPRTGISPPSRNRRLTTR
jgi:hypothetical protein